MSKAKSIVITALLTIAIVVAAFFAAISFPVQNNVKRLNSIASNIHLGADFSGYAYTTVYPEGVKRAEEYGLMTDEDKAGYEKCGGLYVEKEKYSDMDALKASVAADAEILNARFGKKGYSSYSVAVEDGISIKISIPTNFTYAAYKGNDSDSRSSDLTVAQSALVSLTAYGPVTLRTTDSTLTLTSDGNSTTVNLDTPSKGRDEWTNKAIINGSETYSIAYGYDEDLSRYFKGLTAKTVGTTPVIGFNLTKEGKAMFEAITTRVASSNSQTLYFFVGETSLVSFSCTEAISQSGLSLQASSYESAQNSAYTINSALHGQALSLEYQAIDSVKTSTATYGDNGALLMMVACLLAVVGICVFLVIKYKKLGALLSLMSFAFALVELYALCILGIQLTFGVLLTAIACLALFEISNVALLAEVRRLTAGGRTMQASVKEGYKNTLMTILDMHAVLVVVAILLAAICTGEVAACGLLAVVGVVASFVLYWFTRFMWFVTCSPAKDKFKFAGFTRVVREYE